MYAGQLFMDPPPDQYFCWRCGGKAPPPVPSQLHQPQESETQVAMARMVDYMHTARNRWVGLRRGNVIPVAACAIGLPINFVLDYIRGWDEVGLLDVVAMSMLATACAFGSRMIWGSTLWVRYFDAVLSCVRLMWDDEISPGKMLRANKEQKEAFKRCVSYRPYPWSKKPTDAECTSFDIVPGGPRFSDD